MTDQTWDYETGTWAPILQVVEDNPMRVVASATVWVASCVSTSTEISANPVTRPLNTAGGNIGRLGIFAAKPGRQMVDVLSVTIIGVYTSEEAAQRAVEEHQKTAAGEREGYTVTRCEIA